MKSFQSGAMAWVEPDGFAICRARAAFSTRPGGASQPPFDSLNLGLHVGDDPAAVLENRRRLWSALGLAPDSPVGGEQVHGARVAIVGGVERGRGSARWEDAIPKTDGLATARQGLPLFVLGADCALVALAVPDGRGCAAIHAGWRGLAAGVIEEGAARLAEASSVEPNEMRAFVGAALGPECFEVGEEFPAGLPEPLKAFAVREEGRLHFHYLEAVLARLDSAGLRRQNVEAAGGCTACRVGSYFSHRASGGRTGRMAMTVWLP